jgi:hypothetical protein
MGSIAVIYAFVLDFILYFFFLALFSKYEPKHLQKPIQHYVIKFVSDLRQVDGFLWGLWFPPPIKLTAKI